MVAGVRVVGADITDAEVYPDNTFTPCPLASALGVPLVVKREAAIGEQHEFYRISRFMTDPQDGIADLEWAYGGMCGPAPPIIVARTDGTPFCCCDFIALEDFLKSFFDDDDYPRRLNAATRLDFVQFLKEICEPSSPAFLEIRFPKDSLVQAHDLQTHQLNGEIGVVIGEYKAGRIGVLFRAPHNRKSVRSGHLWSVVASAISAEPVTKCSEKGSAGRRPLSNGQPPAAITKKKASAAWQNIGHMWKFPEILSKGDFALTEWEFGIQYEGIGDCRGSILPLRLSADSGGGVIAIPQAGGMLASDWWRGRLDPEALPVTVYSVSPNYSRASGREACYSFDSLQGFLCHSDGRVEVMSEPQAPCYPSRVKLMARKLSIPWAYAGHVGDLEILLDAHPLESHRYAVQWTVDETGWQPNGAITTVVREVVIRLCGRSVQISPCELEAAWEMAVVQEPRKSASRQSCFRVDDEELPDLDLVEYMCVIGRECFVKHVDYNFSPSSQWYFRRQRHAAAQNTSVPSPQFDSAPVYVCARSPQ